MFGGANYSGELSQDPVTLKETHPAGGAFLRYNLNPKWTIKGNCYYGEISGNDSNGTSAKHKARGLSFISPILDIGANVEYNFFGFEAGGRKNHFSPYIFAGLSVFHFNPQAYYAANSREQGSYIALQPLGTEAQGTTYNNGQDKYNLTQISIPFGIGVKLNVYENYNVGFELGWRKTFTDYLDDVSGLYPATGVLKFQTGSVAAEHLSNPEYYKTGNNLVAPNSKVYRGDPTTMDWYMFAGITISYTFLPSPCFSF